MLIDAAHPEEVRVCVLENGRVEDFDFEFSSRKPLRGNIYLARVTRVEPSLQAAFVEYGGNRHGFLAFNEIHPDYYQIPVSDRRLLQEAEAEESALAAELGLDSREDDSDLDADDHGGGDEDDDGGDFRDAERAAAVREEDGDQHESAAGDDPHVHEKAEDQDDHDADDRAAATDESDEAVGHDTDDGSDDDTTMDDGAANEDTPRAAVLASEPSEAQFAEPSNEDASAAAEPTEENDPAPRPARKDKPANARRGELLERYREARRKRQRLLRNYKIQEVIKRRQIMLVQVVKEERGTKGAALTTYMSLAGRYCVLMPNTARGGGISRKIGVAADRKRLRRVVDSLEVPQGMGLIIRTAGAKRTKVEIKRDYDYLTRLWENIRTLTLQSIAPCLIYEEASLIKRAIRDLYDKDIDQITVEGDDGYREAKDFMKMLMPSHAKNVRQHKDGPPLFLANDVESQLDAMYQPTVRLKSGGYLVIHQTEALVAIDVNSGKATRERNIEQTALKTNLEAAKEAARQCRLRDLAGLIVIDFIDMEEQRNNRSVEKRFKDALKDDRARIQVGRISNFGLLEMSRQRRRSGIVDGTTHTCPTCNGAGNVRSNEMAALRILRAIETSALKERSATIAVRAALDVTLYILNHKRAWLKRIEDAYAVTVEIVADGAKAGDNFELDRRGAARELPQTTQVVRADQTEAIEIEAPRIEDADETDDGEAAHDRAADDRGARRDDTRAEGEGGGRRRRRRRRRGRREEGFGQREDGGEQRQPRMHAAPETAGDGEEDEGEDEADSADDARADRPQSEENGDGANGEGRRRRRRGRRGGRRNRHRDGEDGQRPVEHRTENPSADVDAAATGELAEERWTHAPEPAPAEPSEPWRAERPVDSPSRWNNEPADETPVFQPPPRPAEPVPAEAQDAEPEAPPREPRPQRKGWWQKAIGG
jgi:ribonuclease E